MSATDLPDPPTDATEREKDLWKELLNRIWVAKQNLDMDEE